MEITKKCTKCGKDKELDLFSNITKKNGITVKHSHCKKCKNKSKEERIKNTDKYKLRKSKISNKSKLKIKYNLSIEEYNKMVENQDSRCMICNNKETRLDNLGNIQRLSVDHCHTTGKIRGLLCGNCNTALGHFKDSIFNLESAIEYLRKSHL